MGCFLYVQLGSVTAEAAFISNADHLLLLSPVSSCQVNAMARLQSVYLLLSGEPTRLRRADHTHCLPRAHSSSPSIYQKGKHLPLEVRGLRVQGWMSAEP